MIHTYPRPIIETEAVLEEQFAGRLHRQAPIAGVTTMGLGGPARLMVEVRSEDELARAVTAAREGGLAWYVIGGGSNIIGADEGYDGLVILNRISGLARQGNRVTAGAGSKLLDVLLECDRLGLAGMERLAGIPGTIGGAVCGCAGAYGQEIADFIVEVRFYDTARGEFRSLDRAGCRFGYRESIFKTRREWIITQATFQMPSGQADQLLKTSNDLLAQRAGKFPGQMRCPGCFFKNVRVDAIEPDSLRRQLLEKVPASKVVGGKIPAGYLLQESGASGLHRGAIRVADLHGNLLFNTGPGCTADLLALVADLKARVRRRFGVELHEEVQFLGPTTTA